MTQSSLSAPVRPLDPNVKQRRASDPLASVWVGASAGTGKTKVLVDRLLRLFLPRPDGRPGTPPHRILCLTFTKAGASEMALRINNLLSEWATISLEDPKPDKKGLKRQLKDLTGEEPSIETIEAARRLFAQIVDTSGGLKIMTIHAFCQAVLGRFPLEAGLSPHFTVIEEATARTLLTRARDRIIQDPAYKESISAFASAINEDSLTHLLLSLSSERRHLLNDAQITTLYEHLGVSPHDDENTIMTNACADDAFDKTALYRACKALASGAKTDQARGIEIQLWLDSPAPLRLQRFNQYKSQFITQKSEPRKTMASKGALTADPECGAFLSREAQRLLALDDKIRAVKTAQLTAHLFTLGRAVIDEYQTLKDRRAALDYDDLVLRTLALLEQNGIAPWVLFKLDGGLDHILIDEAQDTNPEQWHIIAALSAEFFSGQNAHDETTRTLFTVGDEKQSIYSFQRAAPQEFEKMRAYFAEKISASGQTWQPESLNISFRTTASVLRLVDETFAEQTAARAGLGEEIESHLSFRTGQAGEATLWPLFAPEEREPDAPWTPPVTIHEQSTPQARLADHIGTTIKDWLDTGETLKSQGRPIHPGDIMILVRTRSAFVGQIVRALKTRNIPVSGVDRMVLGQQLAVMDLRALAGFALLPDDDLTLACILKSPFIGWNDEQLEQLALNRPASLWRALQDTHNSTIVDWLNTLIKEASQAHPYEFFAQILQRPCPADPVSGLRAVTGRLGEDALDPLDEFLNAALAFEREHIPALQNFLIWQEKEDITIKRALEEAGKAVRIMTVHGSKGLQAPIVILPDTTRTSAAKRTPRLLWPDKSDEKLPLWCPNAAFEPELYKTARARVEQKLDEEYRRLLYVAMTRAEDRLYIGGYKGVREPIDDSWYNYVAAAFARFDDCETIPFGEEQTAVRISNPQTRDVEPTHRAKSDDFIDLPILDWMRKPAPAEPFPPRPLTPSRPALPEPAAHSPLAGSGAEQRFKRGNITHKLLEILPDLPPEKRRAAARHFVSRPAHELSNATQESIINETLAILEHPAYAPLFGPASQAEVPVTGFVNGQLISGQIDRLLVTDHDIMIIDYKTNRPAPRDEKDIPEIYRRQMQAYRDLMREIYPGRPARCFLLWTDGPLLMSVEN